MVPVFSAMGMNNPGARRAARGVIPADQGFHADDVLRGELHLGLVLKLEFLVVDGL